MIPFSKTDLTKIRNSKESPAGRKELPRAELQPNTAAGAAPTAPATWEAMAKNCTADPKHAKQCGNTVGDLKQKKK